MLGLLLQGGYDICQVMVAVHVAGMHKPKCHREENRPERPVVICCHCCLYMLRRSGAAGPCRPVTGGGESTEMKKRHVI